MSNLNREIKQFQKAMDKCALQAGKMEGTDRWPINYMALKSAFIKDFIKKLYEGLQKAKETHTEEELAQSFGYPTSVYLTFGVQMAALRFLNLSPKKKVEFFGTFTNLLKHLMSGDIFCADNTNRIWSAEKTQEEVQKLAFIEITDPTSPLNKDFSYLNGLLLNLTENIFWGVNCAARETHGPYQVARKGEPVQLIVREYTNFRPLDLMPQLKENGIQSVKTSALYTPGVTFDFAVLSDYTHDKPLLPNTLAIAGECKTKDGETVVLNDKESINSLIDKLTEVDRKVSAWVSSLSKKELFTETARRYYYRVKPIWDLLDWDWEPSKEVLEAVAKASKKPLPTPKKITREQFYQAFDPRI